MGKKIDRFMIRNGRLPVMVLLGTWMKFKQHDEAVRELEKQVEGLREWKTGKSPHAVKVLGVVETSNGKDIGIVTFFEDSNLWFYWGESHSDEDYIEVVKWRHLPDIKQSKEV